MVFGKTFTTALDELASRTNFPSRWISMMCKSCKALNTRKDSTEVYKLNRTVSKTFSFELIPLENIIFLPLTFLKTHFWWICLLTFIQWHNYWWAEWGGTVNAHHCRCKFKLVLAATLQIHSNFNLDGDRVNKSAAIFLSDWWTASLIIPLFCPCFTSL